MTSYGGIIRIRLKGRSLITSSQPSTLSSPTQFITNVFSRNSDVSLFHNSKYLAVMETISQNSFRRLRCNEVPGICCANSLPKQGFDSGNIKNVFPHGTFIIIIVGETQMRFCLRYIANPVKTTVFTNRHYCNHAWLSSICA